MERNLVDERINIESYRTFMDRAFRLDKRITRPHKMELGNLINAEYGKTSKILGSHSKQLNDIKIRLKKGIEIMSKEIENEDFQYLYLKVNDAKNSNDIIDIVNEGLELSKVLIK